VRLDSSKTLPIGEIPNFDCAIECAAGHDRQLSLVFHQGADNVSMATHVANEWLGKYPFQLGSIQSSLIFSLQCKWVQFWIIVSLDTMDIVLSFAHEIARSPGDHADLRLATTGHDGNSKLN
jgi:hypothetical protein